MQIAYTVLLIPFCNKLIMYYMNVLLIIELYIPRRSLQYSSRCMVDVPKIRTKNYGARWFSYAAATLWNAIFYDGLKNLKHIDNFRKGLKHIFSNNTFISVLSLFSLHLVLQKVFDTLNHVILLKTLEHYRIRSFCQSSAVCLKALF